MSENEEIRDATDQHEDPADVLASMAANQPDDDVPAPDEDVDPSEALDRLAESEPAGAPGDEFVPPSDDGEVANAELAEATGVSGREALRARQAHAVVAGRRMTTAHRHVFKRWMVPLLAIVGVLLLVVGVLSYVILGLNEGKGDRDDELTVIMAISFPMAAIVIFGAWWCHRDVRRRR